MKKPKTVLVTGRIQKHGAVATAKKVIAFLEKRGVKVHVDSFFPVQEKTVDLNKVHADLVLCFGGDGSLLHTFHSLKKNVPVMGVNCGARGSLMALTKENVLEKLPEVLNGNFVVEKRTRLKVFADGKECSEALNEALIVPQKPGRILKYHVVVDGLDLGLEADDGLIVATPTGSTAHSQSAGGPQVTPSAKVFVIVRCNPIDLNRRPLVVNDHSEIRITQIENAPVQVIVDGQLSFTAHKEIRIINGKAVLLARMSK